MRNLKTTFKDIEVNISYITDNTEATIICSKLINSKVEIFGLDIETFKHKDFLEHKKAGLDPYLSGIRLVQIYDGLSVYIFDLYKVSLDTLKEFMYAKRFVAHNAAFEIKHFTFNGFSQLSVGCSMLLSMLITNAETSPFEPEIYDFMPELAEELEEEGEIEKYKRTSHTLSAVSYRLFGLKISKVGQTSNWNQNDLTNEQLLYAALDAILTFKIGETLGKKLQLYKMVNIYNLQKDMLHVVADMEINGFPVDWVAHANLVELWKNELEKAVNKCVPYFGGTNLRSSPQMNNWLSNRFKDEPSILATWPRTEPSKRNPTGCYSFNRLKLYPYWSMPEIAALIGYKKYSILVSTYGDKLAAKKHPITGNLHGSFFLGETRTGRMSSRDPNLQNLPKDTKDIGWSIRDIFKVEDKEKVLVVADFSQIEIRVGAALSLDPTMTDAFKKGIDLHMYIVHAVTGKAYELVTKYERQFGKAINFGLMFGMRARKLKDYTAMSYETYLSDETALKAYNTYHSTYRVYSSWCNKQRELCKQLGFVRTPMGKMRKLLESELYTRSVNTAVQGGAGECLMIALVKLRRLLKGLPIKILSTVHDEIILESPLSLVETAKDILEKSMSYGMSTLFPNAPLNNICDAHYGVSWKDTKP